MNIIEELKDLSLAQKEVVFRELGVMIQKEKHYRTTLAEEMGEKVRMKVCAAMGLTEYNPNTRERSNVIARVITANLLLRMGHSESQVGRAMKKNHTTVHYYRKTMREWMDVPSMYQEELSIWNQTLQEYETDTRTI